METAKNIGFGRADNPTGYQEIKAWCFFSKLVLSPFEAELIVSLCERFISEYQVHKEGKTMPPYKTEARMLKINKTNKSSWMSKSV